MRKVHGKGQGSEWRLGWKSILLVKKNDKLGQNGRGERPEEKEEEMEQSYVELR